MTFAIDWLSHNRKAQCPPDPKYPEGMTIETEMRPACTLDLPYPAPECGVWIARCQTCKTKIAITAAGRPDDVKRVMVPCKTRKH